MYIKCPAPGALVLSHVVSRARGLPLATRCNLLYHCGMTAPLPPTRQQTPDVPEAESVDDLLMDGKKLVLEQLYSFALNLPGDLSRGQQLKAIELFLDRSMGKAAQQVDLTYNTNDVLALITQGSDPESVLEVIENEPEDSDV